MNSEKIIEELERNKTVFKELLSTIEKDVYLWKANPNKWCILELVCHLLDEELEDFRIRVQYVLKSPERTLPPIDPASWVKDRKYIEQDYKTKVASLLLEREKSIQWLQGLKEPKWDTINQHPKVGPRSAMLFLANWLAHDYLHINQLLKIKLEYLKVHSGENLEYAGGV